MSLYKELQELENEGIDLVAILGRDRPCDPEDLVRILRRIPRGTEGTLYSELFFFLTYRRFPEERARSLWNVVLRHKEKLRLRLGRDVGFRVAMLDYLTNKQPLLKVPRIVAKHEFDGLLDHVVIDELTQVYNRRYFNEQLQREVNRARRYGAHLSLLLIDIDNFKAFNDTYGHLRGDDALRRFGALLRENARETDTICRYGGDEFVLLCPGTSKSDAQVLGERLRRAGEACEIATAEGAKRLSLRLTIGISTYPEDTDESSELIEIADRSLYQAKRGGMPPAPPPPSGAVI
ncbi:MAG: GGDEF domain-containing protein [Planctomycetes bacterium]|nr:GGDEF domain-containing protein [Planctomycetota bacterium]